MRKVRIIEGVSKTDLEEKTNEALSSIESESILTNYNFLDKNIVVIEYEAKEVKLMCVDCQFYDNSASIHKAWGVCQCKGQRVRFNSEICDRFCDLRG